MRYTYHHLGIPTTASHPDERYVPRWKFHTWGYETGEFRIQRHRYDPDCELPELIQTVAHVAFKIENLEEALRGRKVIFGPHEPFEGWRVAFIEENGAPIEFVDSSLTEEEITAQAVEKSVSRGQKKLEHKLDFAHLSCHGQHL